MIIDYSRFRFWAVVDWIEIEIFTESHTKFQTAAKNTCGFLLPCRSPKIEEAQPDQQVNLSYARTDKYDYLSISGAAELFGELQALWSPWLKPLVPKRAWTIRDTQLCSKSASWAVEYWDAPDSATTRAYGLVKALVIGDTDIKLSKHITNSMETRNNRSSC